MTARLAWRPLPLSESSDLPVLLICMEVSTAAYTVRLTDMANIWIESLDRKAICMRGWGENTSIDPSDTPENMAKFLKSIQSALDTSQPGYDQTSMSLSPASPSDAGEGGLTLKVECRLPGLQPLKWPIHMRKAPPSAIATSLVLPLVQAQKAWAAQVESLILQLSNKDAILNKLVDKLEATGTGLEHVFHALSGKKKVSRSSAQEKVKGLAAFNRSRWQAEMDREEGPKTASSLVQEVFSAESLGHPDVQDFEPSQNLDRWWIDLAETLYIPSHAHASHSHSQEADKTGDEPSRNDDDDDDEFQVQATPPHLKSDKHHGQSQNHMTSDDVSTDSGEEDNTTSPTKAARSLPSPDKTELPKLPATARRVGVVGGRNPQPAHRSPSPEDNTSPGDNTNGPPGSETASDASELEAEAKLSGEQTSSSLLTSKPAAKKGRVGQIGGKSKTRAVSEEAPKNEDSPEAKPNASSPRRPKLGIIGKPKKTAGSTTSNEKGHERGRSASRETTKDKDAPRESSTERADRRREELKRELEKKAAAGPVKKRRKF